MQQAAALSPVVTSSLNINKKIKNKKNKNKKIKNKK
jgi:hypothetical protein